MRNDEIKSIAAGPTEPVDVAKALTPTMRDALAEVEAGTFAASWCGRRRAVMAKIKAIGSYSDTPSVVASASDGGIVLTPFGARVLAEVRR